MPHAACCTPPIVCCTTETGAHPDSCHFSRSASIVELSSCKFDSEQLQHARRHAINGARAGNSACERLAPLTVALQR
jgi:hypothetical protein